MKKVQITVEKCKYAQKHPSLPTLDFEFGKKYDLEDYLADSIIKNGDGVEIEPDPKPDMEIEKPSALKPEIKEKPQKFRGKKKRNK